MKKDQHQLKFLEHYFSVILFLAIKLPALKMAAIEFPVCVELLTFEFFVLEFSKVFEFSAVELSTHVEFPE